MWVAFRHGLVLAKSGHGLPHTGSAEHDDDGGLASLAGDVDEPRPGLSIRDPVRHAAGYGVSACGNMTGRRLHAPHHSAPRGITSSRPTPAGFAMQGTPSVRSRIRPLQCYELHPPLVVRELHHVARASEMENLFLCYGGRVAGWFRCFKKTGHRKLSFLAHRSASLVRSSPGAGGEHPRQESDDEETRSSKFRGDNGRGDDGKRQTRPTGPSSLAFVPLRRRRLASEGACQTTR